MRYLTSNAISRRSVLKSAAAFAAAGPAVLFSAGETPGSSQTGEDMGALGPVASRSADPDHRILLKGGAVISMDPKTGDFVRRIIPNARTLGEYMGATHQFFALHYTARSEDLTPHLPARPAQAAPLKEHRCRDHRLSKFRGSLVGVDMVKLRRLVDESRAYLFAKAGYEPDIFASRNGIR